MRLLGVPVSESPEATESSTDVPEATPGTLAAAGVEREAKLLRELCELYQEQIRRLEEENSQLCAMLLLTSSESAAERGFDA